ncbi:hypothetical protein MMC13_006905 [Lambiella insularis]|nr:hypothetical protein [Lambiella insularis]
MSPNPISIHIPPSLRKHAIAPSDFLNAHPQYATLAVGAFIFAPSHLSSPAGPRLLLVQRAAAEPSFPSLWEVPGGGVEPSDPTVFHSVAREAFEETGLRLQRVVRQIGDGEEFMAGSNPGPKPCLKLNFEIEVQEIGNPIVASISKSHPVHHSPDGSSHQDDHDDVTEETVLHSLESIDVVVDPKEHQNFRWVSEGDVRSATCLLDGTETDVEKLEKKKKGLSAEASGALPLVSRLQQKLILESFALHNKAIAIIHELIDRSSFNPC